MPTETSSPETVFALVKWLIVLALWAAIAIGIYHDSKRLRKLQDSVIGELLHVLSRRNLYLFGLVSMLLVIAVADDTSRIMERQEPMERPPEVAKATVSSTPAAQPADDGKYAVPHDSKIPYTDITVFNEANGKQQAYIDLLKERYETWIITYDYLKKCNKVNPQDLDAIMASLRKELQNAHADSSVEGNITLAAEGSYKEMYSDIPCDEAHISSTKAGYDVSMKQIVPQTTATPAAEAPVEKPQLSGPANPTKAAPVTPVTQSPIDILSSPASKGTPAGSPQR